MEFKKINKNMNLVNIYLIRNFFFSEKKILVFYLLKYFYENKNKSPIYLFTSDKFLYLFILYQIILYRIMTKRNDFFFIKNIRNKKLNSLNNNSPILISNSLLDTKKQFKNIKNNVIVIWNNIQNNYLSMFLILNSNFLIKKKIDLNLFYYIFNIRIKKLNLNHIESFLNLNYLREKIYKYDFFIYNKFNIFFLKNINKGYYKKRVDNLITIFLKKNKKFSYQELHILYTIKTNLYLERVYKNWIIKKNILTRLKNTYYLNSFNLKLNTSFIFFKKVLPLQEVEILNFSRMLMWKTSNSLNKNTKNKYFFIKKYYFLIIKVLVFFIKQILWYKSYIIRSYLYSVVNLSKKKLNLNNSLELEDLIQQGLLGLISSTYKFEPDYGYSFDTYSTYWIRQGIQKSAISKKNMIQIPANKFKRLNYIQSVIQELENKLKRKPTVQEISNITLFPIEKIYESLITSNNYIKILSLDTPIFLNEHKTSANEYLEFSNIIHYSNLKDLYKLYSKILFPFLEKLMPSIGTLLSMRYGITPYKKHTLNELSEIFHLSIKDIAYLIKVALVFLNKKSK